MKTIKNNFKSIAIYIRTFIKWLICASVLGAAGGVLGSIFHGCIEEVTHLRHENNWLIFLLPLGGIIIAMIYRFFKSKGHIDTNRVLEAVRERGNVPLVMMPMIFVSTAITHMLGGSAGREGAALQLGGSLGYNLGKLFRLDKKDMHIIIMAGMSSVFSALFGTPLTAAIFSLEVARVGIFHYAGLLPCIISSVVAYQISLLFGIAPVKFSNVLFESITLPGVVKVMVLAILLALVSILFCTSIHKCEHYMEKYIKNSYLRAASGAVVIVILTLLVGNQDYNGAGMSVVEQAISGEARYEAFVLKIIFTAITIASGFKGGEIVPTFFIGSTFGCVAASLLGLDAGFGAAIGFVSLFCCVVNCPVASLLLSVEVFGAEGVLYFALSIAVCYLMSGNFGLYNSQKVVYSKTDDSYVGERRNVL